MSLARFKACVAGYSDHIFDLQLLAVYSGYWSGYYSNAKKPKSIKTVFEKLISGHNRSNNKSKHSSNVDVDAFLAAEKQFRERLKRQGSE